MKKEIFIIFILMCLLSSNNLYNLCKEYLPLHFDNQVLFTWEYSSYIGQIPYKDIFFPYGLLNYFKTHNPFFTVLYLLIAPTLLTGFFIIFQKIWQDRLYTYTATIALVAFVYCFTGFAIFSRYGISVLVACIFAYLFFRNKILSKRYAAFMGLLGGLIFPLYNDQGIYIVALFFGFMFVQIVLKSTKIKRTRYVISLLVNVLIFLSVFIIGNIPFINFLLLNDAAPAFISAIRELSDLEELAKTPYFHSAINIENIFTLTLLYISISFLSYKIFYRKHKLTLNNYIQIGLVLILIIFEQKSLIRHIDYQLTFIGLLLLFCLFYEFKLLLQKHKITNFFIFIYFLNILIVVFTIGFEINVSEKGIIPCQNVNTRYAVTSERHLNVKKVLDKTSHFNGKIFSFPGDTIFYMLFKQNPPYYPTAFEASSIEAQQKLIDYINEEHIEYIIYDYENKAIQDEVPNILRSITLNKYIFTNFSIYKQIGDFMILKRNDGKKDFMIDKKLNKFPQFKEQLLNVHLENIPFAEGLYKYNNLLKNKDAKVQIRNGSILPINQYLQERNLKSDDIYIVVEYKEHSRKKYSSLIIDTKIGIKTRVTFKQCKVKIPCIINISNLPLFYNSKTITSIDMEHDDGLSSISILSVPDERYFW